MIRHLFSPRAFVLFAVLATSSACIADATAQTIHRVDVDIEVSADGTATVEERWTVTIDLADNYNIVRRYLGFRDAAPSDIEILSVERNGEPEPWSLSTISELFTLTLGTSYRNPLQEPQQHYVFRYRIARFVTHEKGHDVLLWVFSKYFQRFALGPTFEMTATVTGPPGVAIEQATLRLSADHFPTEADPYYPGATGRLGKSAQAVFHVNSELRDYGNAFILVNFPMGSFSDEPLSRTIFRETFQSHRIAGPVVLGATLLFYLFAWNHTRRRMRRQDRPEAPLSPAIMHFLERGRFDPGAVTAALVSLAGKGWFRFEHLPDGRLCARRGLAHEARADPSPDEQVLLNQTFRGARDSLALDDKDDTDTFFDAMLALRHHIEARYQSLSLANNRAWMLSGLALAGGGIVGLTLYRPNFAYTTEYALLLWFLLVSVGALLGLAAQRWTRVFGFDGRRALWRAILATVAPLIATGGLLWAMIELSKHVGFIVVILAGLALLLSLFLVRAQFRRVKPGPAEREQIEAMRRRIKEAIRAGGNAPDRAVLPDALLAYAVALDRNGRWQKFLSDRVDGLLHPGGRRDRPWYDGGGANLVEFGRVAHFLPGR